MAFPTVICMHFKTHNLPTSIIVYSIRCGRVVKIFDEDQSLQTHACWDYFHGQGAQQLQELEAKCGAKACSHDFFKIYFFAKCWGLVQKNLETKKIKFCDVTFFILGLVGVGQHPSFSWNKHQIFCPNSCRMFTYSLTTTSSCCMCQVPNLT